MESVSIGTKDEAKSIALLSDNMAISSPIRRPEDKKEPAETDRDVLEIRMNLTELLEETISDESLEEAASRPLVEVTLEQEEEEDGQTELPWEPLFLNSSSLQQLLACLQQLLGASICSAVSPEARMNRNRTSALIIMCSKNPYFCLERNYT